MKEEKKVDPILQDFSVADSVLVTVLNSIFDGIYVVDRDRKIIFWNRGAEEITGFSAEEVMGKRCSYLRQRGVDIHTISALMGHRDLRMTKRYAHLNVDNIRDAVAKLGHDLVTVGENEAALSV